MQDSTAEDLSAKLQEYGSRRSRPMPSWPILRADAQAVIDSTRRSATTSSPSPTWPRRTALRMPPAGPPWARSWRAQRDAAGGGHDAGLSQPRFRDGRVRRPHRAGDHDGGRGRGRHGRAGPGMGRARRLAPVEYLGRFDDRVFAIHAKDNAPEGEAEDERGFKALGEGTLDWAAILPAAEEAGAQWYIIEHDQPLDAAEVVMTGATFLTETCRTAPRAEPSLPDRLTGAATSSRPLFPVSRCRVHAAGADPAGSHRADPDVAEADIRVMVPSAGSARSHAPRRPDSRSIRSHPGSGRGLHHDAVVQDGDMAGRRSAPSSEKIGAWKMMS